jgi:hypothetical protein
MQTIALVLVLAVYLLAGCSEFEAMMEERRLTCTPDAVFINSCDGWGT